MVAGIVAGIGSLSDRVQVLNCDDLRIKSIKKQLLVYKYNLYVVIE